MDLPPFVPDILASVEEYRSEMPQLRELLLANAVFCGEIPSPTFEEQKRATFLSDRFTESGLESFRDEQDNVSGILSGESGDHNILVVAHADTLWKEADDHTVTATEDTLKGVGLADNSLGTAALVTIPLVLERLGLQLQNNLILLGTTRSLGRGDLEGLRFFLENTKVPIHGAVCVEGTQLGRLSYSSLGMIRAEITVTVPDNQDWRDWESSGAIVRLHQLLGQILAIGRPESPRTQIILGSIHSGASFNQPVAKATLRLEVRSESSQVVASILDQIEEIIEETNAHGHADANLSVIATREPGELGFGHPLVRSTRAILESLSIEPKVTPSISELSALLDKDIPAVTVGLTRGEAINSAEEILHIEPLYSGMAQLVGILQVIDQLLPYERNH